MTLTELIKSIYDDDTIVKELPDGQRVISYDAIVPRIEGYQLFTEPAAPEAAPEVAPEAAPEATPDKEDILAARLDKLESLMAELAKRLEIDDAPADVVTEVW